MATTDENKEVTEAREILNQLGGKGFLMMTGASNLFAAGRTESNPYPFLRMDLCTELQDERTKVNRLKITLKHDEYTVDFYYQVLGDLEPVVTNRQVFERQQAEDLAPLFRQVTGYETRMPLIHFVK